MSQDQAVYDALEPLPEGMTYSCDACEFYAHDRWAAAYHWSGQHADDRGSGVDPRFTFEPRSEG